VDRSFTIGRSSLRAMGASLSFDICPDG
jgi:hypothetical protein